MAEQIPMWIVNPDMETEAPPPAQATRLCPVCRIKPVAVKRNGEPYKYCGNTCASPTRLCHLCDQPYEITTVGAGTKYCSEGCKKEGYAKGFRKPRAPRTCVLCRAPIYGSHVCKNCSRIHPWADSLRTHNAPDWAWEHMRTTGTCMNPSCGTDISGRIKRGHGHLTTAMQLDHDHGCCPGGRSCGRCVRGILCGPCNLALGLLRDNESIISGLALYLTMVNAAT